MTINSFWKVDNMVYMYLQVSLSWEVEYPVDCREGYFVLMLW